MAVFCLQKATFAVKMRTKVTFHLDYDLDENLIIIVKKVHPFVIRMAPPPPRPAQRVADCAYNALHGRGASSAAVASALLRGAGGAASPPPHPAQRAAEWRGNASGGRKGAHLKNGGAVQPTHPKGTKDASPAERSAARAGRDIC